MKTIKTAVSLPSEVYLKTEKIRKKLGKSRSKMISEALAKVIREVETTEMEARDDEAYRRMPDTKEDIEAATRATAEAWKNLDDEDVNWEEYFAPQ